MLSRNIKSCYFVGIGGAGMSALAKLFMYFGAEVRGCDIVIGKYAGELAALGVEVDLGGRVEGVDECDLLVYSDAVKLFDAHICRAERLGIPVISRGRMLAEVCSMFDRTIAVAGCHGKTTCTSMLAHIFSAAGKGFCAYIGGNDAELGNFCGFGRDVLITEACEYNKNFLLLRPHTAVVLNSDADHLECYSDESELAEAYKSFLHDAQKSICLEGDRCSRGSTTFGFSRTADYCAANVCSEGGKYSFEIFEYGLKLCGVSLKVFGRHNVLNALAAAAAARACGVSARAVMCGLEDFKGVEGRFEFIGEYNGCAVVADYAHHPQEIRAAIRTAREVCGGRIYVIFQPHTYSRTKNLFNEFVECFEGADELLICKTYAAREYFDERGSALALHEAIKTSRYADYERDVSDFLNRTNKGGVILVLGAGDIARKVRPLIN